MSHVSHMNESCHTYGPAHRHVDYGSEPATADASSHRFSKSQKRPRNMSNETYNIVKLDLSIHMSKSLTDASTHYI